MLNDKENFNKLYFKYSIMNYKKKIKNNYTFTLLVKYQYIGWLLEIDFIHF